MEGVWEVEVQKRGFLGVVKVYVFRVPKSQKKNKLLWKSAFCLNAAAFVVFDCTESGILSTHMIVNTVLECTFLVLKIL